MTPEQVAKARTMMSKRLSTNGAIMDAAGISARELHSLRWHLTAMSDSDAASYYSDHLAQLPTCVAISDHFTERGQ